MDRGQTTLDYAIGIGIFLIAVVFVIGFIPGIFEPFAQAQTHATISNRVADRAASDLLGIGVDPTDLNVSCTEAFFEGTVPGHCQFDTTELNDAFGVNERYQLNLTIEDSTGITSLSDGGTPVRLAAGDPPPDRHRSVTVAQRAVYLDGETYRLLVRVWD